MGNPLSQVVVRMAACLMVLSMPSSAQVAWEHLHESGVKAAREVRFADAERLLFGSVTEARKNGAINRLLARSLLDLAEVYRTEGKYDLAQPCYAEALRIDQKQDGD